MSDRLDHLREVAALGCLLNAVSHDLNNQLTNLMLGADQAQYTGSKDAIDLMVRQAQRIAEITKAVQALGQRNMSEGAGRVELGSVLDELAGDGVVELGTVAVASVHARPANVALALSLLANFGGGGAMRASVSVDEVPRSSWAGSDETVPMAVIRLTRGTPPEDLNASVGAMIDDFFGGPRTSEEVGVMAAWEILRKVRGRPSARLAVHGPEGGGTAIVVTLPLAD